MTRQGIGSVRKRIVPNQHDPRITRLSLLPSSAFSMASPLLLLLLLLLLPTLVPWASSRAFTEILAPRCLGRALRIFEKFRSRKIFEGERERERERLSRKREAPSTFFFFFLVKGPRDAIDAGKLKLGWREREREREATTREEKRRSSVHTPPVFQFRPRAGLHSRGLNET